MAVQKEEIMALKSKCKHLEEAMEYYKNKTMSSEGENLVNNNNMNQASQEYSVYKP